MRRFSALLSAVVISAIFVCVGWWLHHEALKVESGHSQTTLVTSYAQVSSLIEKVSPSDIPVPVQDAKKSMIVSSNGVPNHPPDYNASSIIKDLISYKNQLRITKYSRIYVFYLNSTDTGLGNSIGGRQEANWLVVCTGLTVPKTAASRLIMLSNPSLFRRAIHRLVWYFGIPPYPDAWDAWLYSAETGQMIQSTSGATPQSSWSDYVLVTP